ncbi:MAG: oligopeptide transporter, OPT family [Deltaproteobacteria bacterium]|nr:MAG: oligopeptide transporter, OPT family [Deltaproteobacteria bacterium]
MQVPALEQAPESQAPRTATADRVPIASEEVAHKPFIPAEHDIPELTPVPLIVGTLLGILFGASSMYLVLKVGLTVSASIPVAVLSITIFRGFTRVFRTRRATILENNITQTAGSAGESIAFGVGVTMPALLILGYNLQISQVILVSILGGLLGILMMIPLRRALIVKEAKTLVYPEGTACAEVLISGETGGTTAKTVFAGLGVGGVFALGYKAFGAFKDIPEKIFGKAYDGGNLSLEVGPELMGVGYIIGTRIAMIMGAGGILSSLVLMPAIKLFGSTATTPIYPATTLIKNMSTDDVWHQYILYIGAGAVAAGGIISLFKSLPTIVGGAMRGMRSLSGSQAPSGTLRTDRDIPLWVVGVGSLLIVIVCALVPSFKINVLGAVLILVLGFLFVTVSSRLTGEVGSSSNPISGMTVATLLITSLIFFALGWVTPPYKVAALSIAAVACIAISNGGTTSQDLKTGYLVGATPSRQQIAILVGALASALVLGFVILKLNDAGTVFAARSYPNVRFSEADYSGEKERLRGADSGRDANAYNVIWLREPRGEVPAGKYLVDDTGHIKYLEDPGINGKLDTRDNGEKVKSKFSAPKPVLMSFIIEGIMTQRLPWGLVLIGVFVSVVLELCGMSSLAFAVGVYLPLSTSTPIMMGGIVRYIADRTASRKLSGAEAESGPGVLFASGLIAGASVIGTILAFLQLSEPTRNFLNSINVGGTIPGFATSNLVSLALFCVLGAVLWAVATERWLAPKQA